MPHWLASVNHDPMLVLVRIKDAAADTLEKGGFEDPVVRTESDSKARHRVDKIWTKAGALTRSCANLTVADKGLPSQLSTDRGKLRERVPY